MQLAYTDSVLFSLPIVTTGPNGGDLVDLTPVFMSDLPQIGNVLPGFMFSPQKSTWASVKGFKDNVELQVAATYASGGGGPSSTPCPTAAARRSTSIIRSASCRAPATRRGWPTTASATSSRRSRTFRSKSDQRPLRALHQPLGLAEGRSERGELSPPKKPIIFWIEKTVPFKYRKPIRDGI